MEQTLTAILGDAWDVTFVWHVDDSTGEPLRLIECCARHGASGHWCSVTAPTAGEALTGVAEEVRAFGRWPDLFPEAGAHPPRDEGD